MPEPKPFSGLAMSALRPSAATVSACMIAFCAPSGKPSKALRAALIHEIGRVSLLLIGHGGKYGTMRQGGGILVAQKSAYPTIRAQQNLGRPNPSFSCCFLKVVTHPLKATCDLVLCFGCSCWPKFTTLEFAKDHFKSFIKIVIGFARRPIRVKVYYQRTGFVRRHSEVRHELLTDLFCV